MATGKQLSLSILLKAIDQATGPIKKLNGQLQAMNAPIKRLSFEMNKFASLSGLSAVKSGLADVGRETVALTAKVTALGAGLAVAFGRTFVTPHAEFKRLQTVINELEGSAERGEKAFQWIRDFATRTPLTLNETTKAFMKLKAFGMDPMNGTLQALVDSNAKIGGDFENLQGIILQLGQAVGKGKLQAQDLNILQERGFFIVDKLAKVYGKSTKEVREAISEGRIGQQAIMKAIVQAGKDAEGAADRQSKGWIGLIGRLGSAWESVRTVIMDSGPFKFLEERLAAMVGWLEQITQSAEGMAQLREIGARITSAFVVMESGAKQLWIQIEALAARVGGFGTLAKYALGGAAAIIAGPLIMGIGSLAAAIATITVALGPWSLILAAVAAAIGVVYAHWDDLVKLYQSTVTTITDGIESTVGVFKGLAGVIRDSVGSAIQWITDKWKSFMDATAGIRNVLGFVGGHIGAQITGGAAPKFPGVAQQQRIATPSPFTGRGAPAAQRGEFKHQIGLNIDQEGRVRVRDLRSSSRDATLAVDAGLMGAAW
jgi:tape measure domain-containing protein